MKTTLLLSLLLLMACGADKSTEDPSTGSPKLEPGSDYISILDGKTFHKVGTSGVPISDLYSIPNCRLGNDADIDANGTDDSELTAWSFDKNIVTYERRWYKDLDSCLPYSNRDNYDVIDTYKAPYTIIKDITQGEFTISFKFATAQRLAVTAAGVSLLNSGAGTCGQAWTLNNAISLIPNDSQCSGNRMREGWTVPTIDLTMHGKHMTTPNESLEFGPDKSSMDTFGNP